MKKLKLLFLMTVLCFLLTGCDLWMNGYYHDSQPHMPGLQIADHDQIKVKSYIELRNAIERLVEDCSPKCVIHTQGIAQESVNEYMKMAISYVKLNNPVGAYALQDVKYDIGTNTGVQAVAVEFTYSHLRSEILTIKHIKTMGQAEDVIAYALRSCDASVLIQVEEYEKMDIAKEIQHYADNHPSVCMESPKVTVRVFPEHGRERLLDIQLKYETSKEHLLDMQETVQNIFKSAELYVEGDAADREKFAQLYSFLMERFEYRLEPSITPAYSLLRNGVGDGKAFATVYAGMCRQAGLQADVIYGVRNGEPWHWNRLQTENGTFYLDLLKCAKHGRFQVLGEEELAGYVWDKSEDVSKKDS